MGKSEVGSPKWAAKQMKMKGLQRLRWFCQACEKQCRDEHGFRLHNSSPSHIARLKIAESHKDEYSAKFQAAFMSVLRTYHDTPVGANRVYNEMIQDKQHIRMNSTHFRSLTSFVKHLQAQDLLKIEATDPELIIKFIDLEAERRKQRETELIKEVKKQDLENERHTLLQAIEAQRGDAEGEPSRIYAKDDAKNVPNSCPEKDEKDQAKSAASRPKISFSLKRK